MPIVAACPNCQSILHIPEECSGRKIRCGDCQQIFPVPGVDLPVESANENDGSTAQRQTAERQTADPWKDDDPYEDWQAKKPHRSGRRRRLRKDWSSVRTGISVLFWSTILSPVAAVGGIFGLGIFGILTFIGLIYCCKAPSASRTKGLAVGSVIMAAIGPLGVIIFFVILGFGLLRFLGGGFWSGAGIMRVGLSGIAISGLLILISIILHLLYLRRVAKYVGDAALAQQFTLYLISIFVPALIGIGIYVGWRSFGNSPGGTGGGGSPVSRSLTAIVAGLLMLLWQAWRAYLLHRLGRLLKRES